MLSGERAGEVASSKQDDSSGSKSRGGGGSGLGRGGLLRSYSTHLYVLCLVLYLCFRRTVANSDFVDGGEDKSPGRFQVAKFNYEHVSDVYAITLWILLGSLAKIAFHLSHKLTVYFPESCLLVLLGLVVGALFYATQLAEQKSYVLNSDTFFIFLLPPIILEAGYFMPNRPFFNNIGTILLFAIANTLFNTIAIGLTLWGFSFTPLYGGTEFEMLHCFVFAALVSAVDPVAVLATFLEIQVNDTLYIVVFGESLLNDAVSVVLYRLFDSLSEIGSENVKAVDVVLGCTSFFVVALGGVLIGLIFGIIGSFTTKFSQKTPVLEPLIIVTYAYLSYLTAEMTSTSGILAITFCGMFMKQYVPFNIAKKSNGTIEYVLKMFASIMETIIFMFMGLSTISDHHSWNTGFVLITILCCTVYRFIGCFIFGTIANRWRLLELKVTDMLIMSYGGIRGAVAFALALILDENRIPRKKEFVTATIAMVFFTVFIQGTTIGPVVRFLRVKRKEQEEPTMSATLAKRVIDQTMSLLEDIVGVSGKNSLRVKVRNFDRKFIKPLLLRDDDTSLDQKLMFSFNVIHEDRMSKKAKDPGYGMNKDPSKGADPEANNSNENVSVVMQVPTASKLKTRRATAYHSMLDDAINSTRKRRGTMFKIQIEDDDEVNDPELAARKMMERRMTLGNLNSGRKYSLGKRMSVADVRKKPNEIERLSKRRKSTASHTKKSRTSPKTARSAKRAAKFESTTNSSDNDSSKGNISNGADGVSLSSIKPSQILDPSVLEETTQF